MTPHKSIRERAAYEAGRADAQRELGDAKPLSREAIKAMSTDQVMANMSRVNAALASGLRSEDELEDAEGAA